jgi:hypothetical protein
VARRQRRWAAAFTAETPLKKKNEKVGMEAKVEMEVKMGALGPCPSALMQRVSHP